MPQQKSHDVLFMDVHGVFLTAEDLSNSGAPLIGHKRHQKWVDAVRQSLEEAGALPVQIKAAFLDSLVLWTLRMHIELTTSQTSEGKFYERVNLRLLRKVAPTFMRGLDRKGRKRIAQRVRQLRQDASRYGYILEPEMRELVHWLVEDNPRGWMLYLTTAGDLESAAKELRAENAPLSLFIRIFTTQKVGLPKSHPDYWRTIAAEARSSTARCLVVEDNMTMGINAAKAGMSVIFLDRGYGVEDFIRDKLGGKVAGVDISRVGESLSLGHEQFVVCAKTPAGIKLCLQRIQTASKGGA